MLVGWARRVAARWTAGRKCRCTRARWRRKRGSISLAWACKLARAAAVIAMRRVGGMGGAGRGTGESTRPDGASACIKWRGEVSGKVAQEVAGHWCGFGPGRGQREDEGW